jgi:DNA-binding MltR family transcriptional regulator
MARKRPPTTSEEIIQRRDELFEALSKESDRGVVLISASFLGEALESLLRAKFSLRYPKSKSSINPLFDTFGPLYSFSAKVKICYAIDLIGGWMYRDLEIVRKLRNNFAHSVGIARFDLPEVVKLTEELKAADLAVTQISKEEAGIKKVKKTKATKKNTSKSTKADMERARFEMSVSFIGALLYFLTRILNSDASPQEKENIIERILLAK